MSVIKSLFSKTIDYAGLFPPAKLPLEEVVSNYASYIECDDAWMLARLIIPSARLMELEQQPPFLESSASWQISSLVPNAADQAFAGALNDIEAFNQKFARKAVVDTVEIRTPTIEVLTQTIDGLPPSLNAFLEIPHQQDPAEMLAAVANAPSNIFAKIRTGGVTSDLIPSPAEVARFLYSCGEKNVGFKATAGLHHPLRGDYRLTYQSDAPQGTMFGFANVFVAACFAYSQYNDSDLLEEILVESDPSAFEFASDALCWGNKKISDENVKRVRNNQAISFGSCSFIEPTTELQGLGWLSSPVS